MNDAEWTVVRNKTQARGQQASHRFELGVRSSGSPAQNAPSRTQAAARRGTDDLTSRNSIQRSRVTSTSSVSASNANGNEDRERNSSSRWNFTRDSEGGNNSSGEDRRWRRSNGGRNEGGSSASPRWAFGNENVPRESPGDTTTNNNTNNTTMSATITATDATANNNISNTTMSATITATTTSNTTTGSREDRPVVSSSSLEPSRWAFAATTNPSDSSSRDDSPLAPPALEPSSRWGFTANTDGDREPPTRAMIEHSYELAAMSEEERPQQYSRNGGRQLTSSSSAASPRENLIWSDEDRHHPHYHHIHYTRPPAPELHSDVDEADDRCGICLDNKNDHICIPCGHRICGVCALGMLTIAKGSDLKGLKLDGDAILSCPCGQCSPDYVWKVRSVPTGPSIGIEVGMMIEAADGRALLGNSRRDGDAIASQIARRLKTHDVTLSLVNHCVKGECPFCKCEIKRVITVTEFDEIKQVTKY